MVDKECSFAGYVPPHGSKEAGVYFYVQEGTGLTYIGSTVNAYGRYMQHSSALKRGDHTNVKFQKAFDSHPHFDVHFAKLHEELPPNQTIHQVRLMEQAAIDAFDHKSKLLNIATDTFACGANRSPSPETREKIRQAMLGRVVSTETRQRRSQTLMGHSCSDDTREKIRQARLKSENIESSINNLKRATERKCVPIAAGDVVYKSMKDAAEVHGVAATSVKKRILSKKPEFSNWAYLETKSD